MTFDTEQMLVNNFVDLLESRSTPFGDVSFACEFDYSRGRTLAGHKANGWIGQVTPNQSYNAANGEKPPKVKWWDDIRTALDTVVEVGDKLIMIQSFSGPVAAMGASRDVSVRFGTGAETPVYSFPIQSLDLTTGQGIDLDTSR